MTVDPTVGLLAGTGWASGVNLYGVVLLLGVLGRIGWADVPHLLTRPEVLALAGGLYLLDFVVDKVPYLDDLWDLVHTAVRPLGAALLGAALAGDALPELPAAIGTGGVAFISHAIKATTRLAVNTSPEPVSTTAVSLAEDGLVAGVVTLAVLNPYVALAVVVALLVGGTVLAVVIVRAARRGLARWRARRAARRRGERTEVAPVSRPPPPRGR